MYAEQSIQDLIFLMLYGGIAMLAIAAGVYLWIRQSNAIAPAVTPPKSLRRWTAAFFFMAAISHVWWYVIGIYWLSDDRLVRNIICVMLDHITLVPLVIALLLRLLQDQQRRIWPWVMTQTLIIGAAVVGISTRSDYGLDLMNNIQLGVIAVFSIYYIYALVQYNRWLNENYADLENKQVWHSLLLLVALLLIYETYFTNPGDMSKEYMSQVFTLVIIAFLLWRVETLSELTINYGNASKVSMSEENGMEQSFTRDLVIPSNIGSMLEQHCEATQLYLQHDLTLQQLAIAIGSNRTYLSKYFAQQDITYNSYINRLRILHFMQLYRYSCASSRSVTAAELALQSGFHSYSTFAAAFKHFNGQTVTTWMKACPQEPTDSGANTKLN